MSGKSTRRTPRKVTEVKRCKATPYGKPCGKLLRKQNKSGFCWRHYRNKWLKKVERGEEE